MIVAGLDMTSNWAIRDMNLVIDRLETRGECSIAQLSAWCGFGFNFTQSLLNYLEEIDVVRVSRTRTYRSERRRTQFYSLVKS